jgi:thiol-disulfide isomerase/thioredoxin
LVVAGGFGLAACGGSGDDEARVDDAGVDASASGGASPARAGQSVDGRFDMMDGGRRSFADYRGRPLVVNFFASWCVACLAEMPDLDPGATTGAEPARFVEGLSALGTEWIHELGWLTAGLLAGAIVAVAVGVVAIAGRRR